MTVKEIVTGKLQTEVDHLYMHNNMLLLMLLCNRCSKQALLDTPRAWNDSYCVL